MKISTTVLPLGATLLLGGCLEQVWGDLEPWLDTASSGGSTSSTSWTVETTTDAAPTGGVQTVTSATTSPGPDPVDTTSTTTGDPEGPPPTAALSLEPAELTKPGPSSAKDAPPVAGRHAGSIGRGSGIYCRTCEPAGSSRSPIRSCSSGRRNSSVEDTDTKLVLLQATLSAAALPVAEVMRIGKASPRRAMSSCTGRTCSSDEPRSA